MSDIERKNDKCNVCYRYSSGLIALYLAMLCVACELIKTEAEQIIFN